MFIRKKVLFIKEGFGCIGILNNIGGSISCQNKMLRKTNKLTISGELSCISKKKSYNGADMAFNRGIPWKMFL